MEAILAEGDRSAPAARPVFLSVRHHSIFDIELFYVLNELVLSGLDHQASGFPRILDALHVEEEPLVLFCWEVPTPPPFQQFVDIVGALAFDDVAVMGRTLDVLIVVFEGAAAHLAVEMLRFGREHFLLLPLPLHLFIKAAPIVVPVLRVLFFFKGVAEAGQVAHIPDFLEKHRYGGLVAGFFMAVVDPQGLLIIGRVVGYGFQLEEVGVAGDESGCHGEGDLRVGAFAEGSDAPGVVGGLEALVLWVIWRRTHNLRRVLARMLGVDSVNKRMIK